MDNILRIGYEKKVTWFYERTNCSFTDQQTDWVRVRAIFKTQPISYANNLFLFGGKKKKKVK